MQIVWPFHELKPEVVKVDEKNKYCFYSKQVCPEDLIKLIDIVVWNLIE